MSRWVIDSKVNGKQRILSRTRHLNKFFVVDSQNPQIFLLAPSALAMCLLICFRLGSTKKQPIRERVWPSKFWAISQTVIRLYYHAHINKSTTRKLKIHAVKTWMPLYRTRRVSTQVIWYLLDIRKTILCKVRAALHNQPAKVNGNVILFFLSKEAWIFDAAALY